MSAKAVNQVLQDGRKKERKAQEDYDDETTHGLVDDKQAAWKQERSPTG